MKWIPVDFKATKVILCAALYSIKASELESRCTLIYKYKVISSWRDHRKRMYLHIKSYASLLDTLFLDDV